MATLIAGSGVQDVLASNAVPLLSGKAVERAIRGHFLVDATLNVMLMSNAFHIDLSTIIQFQELESTETSYTEVLQQLAHNENVSHARQFYPKRQSDTCETEANVQGQLLEKLAHIIAGRLSITDVQASSELSILVILCCL